MVGLKREPQGELSELIRKFISHKRTLGYKYVIEEDNLYRFSVFSLSYHIVDKEVPSALVNDWVARIPGETFSTQRIRASSLTVFLKFAAGYGYHVVLPPKLKRNARNYVPYIFSEEEITRFFRSCDAIDPYPGTSRHLMLPAIFRVLYGCGLRVSEISNLKYEDVNLDKGVLVIQDGKFSKYRIVPLSASLTGHLRLYSTLAHRSREAHSWFFESKRLQPVTRGWIYRQFRRILVQAGIHHGGKGKGPRAHDLRHTFCVRALKSMVDNGSDIYCALPILATYVGHASTNATQGYVRLTVDIYPELISTISRETAAVIPEVNWNEAD